MKPCFETFILRTIEGHITMKENRSSCKVLVIIVRCTIKLNFLKVFFFKFASIKFSKNFPVGAEAFHTDERTDGHTNRTNPIRSSKIWEGVLISTQI
jgi:hypothetical protein